MKQLNELKNMPDVKPMVGRLRFQFKNPILGGYFSYVLAFASRGVGDIGEIFTAAAEIRERDPESWVQAFTRLAQLVAERADAAMEQEQWISARENALRASLYDRVALMSLSPITQNERYREISTRARARFRQAAALFDPPIEVVELPYQGKYLPGYFMKPDNSGQKRPTIIIVPGGDSIVEDMCYIWNFGEKERGYNFLIVDLPGQGTTMLDGFKMKPDMEVPAKLVVDYALSRPEVDPERLAMWGGSLGGYIVPRVAVHDKRIKAICVNSIILNMSDYITQAKEMRALAKFELMPGYKLLMRLLGGWVGGVINVMDTWKWKWGVKTVAEWLEVLRDFVVDPSGITCPTLLQTGEDELAYSATRRFHEEALEKIAHPRVDLVIGKPEIGAAAKNMLPNLTMIRQTFMDWLDDVFQVETREPATEVEAMKPATKEKVGTRS